MKTKIDKSIETMGTGAGAEYVANQSHPAAAPIANEARRAFEAAREAATRETVSIELASYRSARQAAHAEGTGTVAMAPLGEGRGSKSRALIDRGGEAAEDEARQCDFERLQRIERDAMARLAHAAGQLGERFAKSWLRKQTALSSIRIDADTSAEVVAIYRAAGIAAVMAGEVDGLLGCRVAIRAARRGAYSEIYRASGRHGQDESMDDWESRDEFSGHGSMPGGQSSAPNRSAGTGLRPSIIGQLADWGAAVRAAGAAKIAAASTPAARGNAQAASARRVALIESLISGSGLSHHQLADYFEDGKSNGPISARGRKSLQRLREAIA